MKIKTKEEQQNLEKLREDKKGTKKRKKRDQRLIRHIEQTIKHTLHK